MATLIVVIAIGHGIWLVADRGPLVSPDAYKYLDQALHLADTVAARDWRQLPSLDQLSAGGRPPLYQILTAPFFLVFGRSSDAGIALNGLFLVLLMSATYALSARQVGPAAGLLAALLVATFPPVIHLLRTYRPAAALPACAALSIWLLIELLERRTPRWAWAFWASFAFGLLIHPTYIYVMVVPATFAMVVLLTSEPAARVSPFRRPVDWLRDLARSKLVVRGLLPAILLAAAVIAGWYLTAGRPLWSRLQEASAMAAGRGIKNVTDTFAVEPFNVSPNVWWYAATSRQAIGSCAALLLLPAAAGMVLRRRQASDWVLPVSLLGGYVLLAAQPTYAWMYAAPVLPAVAVLLASWALSLRRRALKTLVTAALVAAAVFQFGWCSWGPWAWPGPSLVSRLGAQHGVRASCRYDRTLCAAPPNPQPIAPDLEPLLGRMLRDPQCKKKRTCMAMVVGLSFPNPQMLSFHLRLRWPQARLHLVTQGSKKLGHRYPINKLLRSDFIVHPARLGQTHGRAKETLEFLRRPPSLWARRHRRVARFKSAGGPLILLKRVREFDLEEREAVADALGVGPYGLPLTSHRP